MNAAKHAHKLTGMNNLVMGGGVALNCVANGKLLRKGPFEADLGSACRGRCWRALGAALLGWYHLLEQPRRPQAQDSQKGSFLGPAFDNDLIGLFLDSVDARYEYIATEEGLIDRVAQLIAQEKIIGWFCGRMEYGPRALGNRSIIGDARSRQMQQEMNLKIKFRESFRPFAPCVLQEHVDQVFEMRRRKRAHIC
jgi:carbamoyltransferase